MEGLGPPKAFPQKKKGPGLGRAADPESTCGNAYGTMFISWHTARLTVSRSMPATAPAAPVSPATVLLVLFWSVLLSGLAEGVSFAASLPSFSEAAEAASVSQWLVTMFSSAWVRGLP